MTVARAVVQRGPPVGILEVDIRLVRLISCPLLCGADNLRLFGRNRTSHLSFFMGAGSMSGFGNETRQFTVCTVDNEPFVDCSSGIASGYDVEVFRSIGFALGWIENVQYTFTCLPSFNDVLNGLKSCDCDAAIGSITPTPSRVTIDGFKFSIPYLCSSLAVLTREEVTADPWSFFKPFSLGVWMLVLFTPVAFGTFMTVLASIASRGGYGTGTTDTAEIGIDWAKRLPVSIVETYNAILGSANTGADELILPGTTDRYAYQVLLRTLFMVYLFFALVISALYTANLASLAIQRKLDPVVTDVNSIVAKPGLKILTNPIYVQPLRSRYNIDAIPWTWFQNTTSAIEAADGVRNGTYDALISDRGILAWLSRQSETCEVTLVPKSDIVYFGTSIAFSPCVNQSIVDSVNYRILEIQSNGELERVARTSLSILFTQTVGINGDIVNPTCLPSSQITVDEIYGLWIILAAVFGGVAIATLSRYWVREPVRIVKRIGRFIFGYT
jgi:ABC-type amino acid transport substrate-binding protein